MYLSSNQIRQLENYKLLFTIIAVYCLAIADHLLCAAHNTQTSMNEKNWLYEFFN